MGRLRAGATLTFPVHLPLLRSEVRGSLFYVSLLVDSFIINVAYSSLAHAR
jgi:hypothetical protein